MALFFLRYLISSFGKNFQQRCGVGLVFLVSFENLLCRIRGSKWLTFSLMFVYNILEMGVVERCWTVLWRYLKGYIILYNSPAAI